MEGSLARALYSFQSDNPGDLSVPEGGIIRIAQYIDNNWLEAEYQGQIGFFPVTYAQRLENEPQLYNVVSAETIPSSVESQGNITFDEFHHHDRFSENTGKLFVEAAFGFVGRNESELTFPTGAVLEVIKDVDDDWLECSFNGKMGLFPKSYVKSSERPCARAIYPFVGESVGELTFREGDCIFLRRRLNSQWMEGEINGNVGLFPSSFVAVEVDLPPEEGRLLNGDFSFMDSLEKHKDQNRSAASKVQWQKGMKGRAVYHFSALYSGDLELNEGDIVTVLQVDDENWLEGQLANGTTGSCPTAYLEPIYNASKTSDDKWWYIRNQRISSHDDFSHLSYPYFIPHARKDDMSKCSFKGAFSQRDDYNFEPGVKTESADRFLLDTSFTRDPTPVLMPSNASTRSQQPYTIEKDKPVLNSKSVLKSKPMEGYSVTYLGSEYGKHSTPQNCQTATSPLTSLPLLSNEQGYLYNNYAVNNKVTSSSNGLSELAMAAGQSSPTRQFGHFVGTWPGKGKYIHGRIAEEGRFNRQHPFYDDYEDDDDMLSGNCTSLPSPLLPLPKRTTNDDNNESSASDDSPITPRRPAPPPPKRNVGNINQVRSNTLPAARSKNASQGRHSQDALPVPSKAKGQGVSGAEDRLTTIPHASSPTQHKRDPSLSPKESPRMRARDSYRDKQLSRPQSWHWKESSTDYMTEKVQYTNFCVCLLLPFKALSA